MPEPRIAEIDMLVMEPKLASLIAALPLKFHKKYVAELLFIPRLIPEIQRLRKSGAVVGEPLNDNDWVRIAPHESLVPKEHRDAKSYAK